ncbi:MAG: hypothetical protein RR420_00680 [Anaerovoracaceae bacterium]
MKINDFYKEHASNPEEFQAIISAIEELGELIEDRTAQVISNQTYQNIETYITVPFQQADISDATYDIENVLSLDSVKTLLGTSQDTVQASMEKWNTSISDDKKAQALEIYGKFIRVTSSKNIAADGYSDSRISIVSMDLYDSKGVQLVEGIDYFYKDDTIYLLGDYATKTTGVKNMIIKNMYLDANVPYRLIGKDIGLEYVDGFTKDEYRDIAVSFTQGVYGGPTLKNMNKSFGTLTYDGGFSVHDRRTKDEVKKGFWDRFKLIPQNKLGVFDFIISLSMNAYYDSEKMNVIRNYLKKTKPCYTKFTISPDMTVEDKLTMQTKEADKATRFRVIGTKSEKVGINESTKSKLTFNVRETLPGTMLLFDTDDVIIDMGYEFDSKSAPTSAVFRQCDKNCIVSIVTKVTDTIRTNSDIVSKSALLNINGFDKMNIVEEVRVISTQKILKESMADDSFSLLDHPSSKTDVGFSWDAVPLGEEIFRNSDSASVELKPKPISRSLSAPEVEPTLKDNVNTSDGVAIKLIRKEDLK